MMDESIRELSVRIDRLERQNRWLQRTATLALLAFGGMLMVSAVRIDESEIVLRDPNNHVPRITLNTNPQTGSAGLQIFDRQGRRRIVLATEAETDRPGLFYFDEAGDMKRQDRD